jgi:hypothetical protein
MKNVIYENGSKKINLGAVISPYIANIAVYFTERVTVTLIKLNSRGTYLL